MSWQNRLGKLLGLQFHFLDEIRFEKKKIVVVPFTFTLTLPPQYSFCDISKVGSTLTFFKNKNSKVMVGPKVLRNASSVGTHV